MSFDAQILTLKIIDTGMALLLLVLGFVHPWVAPRGYNGRVFSYPLLVTVLWVFWRMAGFDAATDNDAPEALTLFTGLMLSIVAFVQYRARCAALRPILIPPPLPKDYKPGT